MNFYELIREQQIVEKGDDANLKIDDKHFRVWQSRVDNSITIEYNLDGTWKQLARLEPKEKDD